MSLDNPDLYHFSSHVPKVKKSIKKYRSQYNQTFLSLLKTTQDESPPKFLQPITHYRFYPDIITIDNPYKFPEDELISPLSLYLKYKSIIHFSVGNTLRVDLQEASSNQWSSLDLYLERLNTLGNKEAHELVEVLKEFKQKPNVREIAKHSIKGEQLLRFAPGGCPENLSSMEYLSYLKYCKEVEGFMAQNEGNFLWKMKRVQQKREDYSDLGLILTELEFNMNCVKLFTNKNLQDFTYETIEELMHITAISNSSYFSFLKGIIDVFTRKTEVVETGIRTMEGCFLPCRERFKMFEFLGTSYSELLIFVVYEVEERHLKSLGEVRAERKREEDERIRLRDARIKSKYQKIKNIGSESLKKLCLLYYANNEESDEPIEDDSASRRSKEFWEKANPAKICKYRSINEGT